MSEAVESWSMDAIPKKRIIPNGSTDDEHREWNEKEWGAPSPAKKWPADPSESLASARHEFGEHGGVNMSIEASATFTVMEPDTMRKMFAGELGPDRDFYIYSRHFNPTVLNLGRQMAALEGTEAAYCTASGMSAISSVILQLCPSGSHIVASRCLYGGTHALLTRFLPRSAGIRTTLVDIDDLESVRAAVKEGETKVIYAETMSNPTLTVADIPGLSAIAREKGVILVVDNTFTPMVVSPAKLGADVVVHSVSKFISGGADIIAEHRCHAKLLLQIHMKLLRPEQSGTTLASSQYMCFKLQFPLNRIPKSAIPITRAFTYMLHFLSLLHDSHALHSKHRRKKL